MIKFQKVRAGNYKVILNEVVIGKVCKISGSWKSYTPDMRKVGSGMTREEAVKVLIKC